MLTVATDGSCHQTNPGPAGWAWVVNKRIWQAGFLPGPITSLEAELTAILFALKAFPDTPLTILTDSDLAIKLVTHGPKGHLDKWVANGWFNSAGKPVASRHVIEQTVEVIENRSVETVFTWVRGHSGHPLNTSADLLAGSACALSAAVSGPVMFHPGPCRDESRLQVFGPSDFSLRSAS